MSEMELQRDLNLNPQSLLICQVIDRPSVTLLRSGVMAISLEIESWNETFSWDRLPSNHLLRLRNEMWSRSYKMPLFSFVNSFYFDRSGASDPRTNSIIASLKVTCSSIIPKEQWDWELATHLLNLLPHSQRYWLHSHKWILKLLWPPTVLKILWSKKICCK